MIVTTHEGLQWAQNYCNEIKERYPQLEPPKPVMVMDLTIAYQNGAQFIQDELKKVKYKLREKSLQETKESEIEPGLTVIKNEDVFRAYEEASKLIDEILTL